MTNKQAPDDSGDFAGCYWEPGDEGVKALEPCPFCGGEWVHMNNPANGSAKSIVCCACNAHGPLAASFTEEQIAAAWNSRTELPRLQSDNARLREALREARGAICEAALDTLWCSQKWPAETVVDHIDAALSEGDGE